MSDDVTFRAIAEAGVLQQYADTYRAVCHEATLFAGPDGLYGEPVDPSSAAMVNQTLAPRGFESYEVPGSDRVRLGMNLDKFADYLDKADSGDPVDLALDAETRRLEIESPSAEFSMALIDPDSIRDGSNVDETGVKDGFVADVEMDTAALSHAVDVVGMVSDHLTVRCRPEADAPLQFVGEGDTDDARVPFRNALEEGSTVDDTAESHLSVEFMEELTGAMPSDATVRCRFGDEWPSLYEYEYADGAAEVEMMLAPRINTH